MFFSFFKKLNKVQNLTDAGPTVVDIYKMTLDERKEWRMQMLRKSIQDSMASLEIISGMYRYRVTALDDRAHFYVVMMETTKHFAISKHTTTNRLAAIEELIKERTFNNYGIVIDAVYWKANETVDLFEQASVKQFTIPSTRRQRTIEELAAQFMDTVLMDQPLAFEPISAQEAATFRSALAQGLQPPPLQVGDKTYDTDLTPLGLK